MPSRNEQQDLICRVTGDTPAGRMMRRYWLPALLVEELKEPDGTPVRVRILGDDLVAFRDTHGRIGIIEAACPHRLASLALGRNEEGGLRCIYHGWKFDVTGACVEMPTEPDTFGFKQRIGVRSYPVREAGGIVWVYLGPPALEPDFPAFDWTQKPREHIALLKFVENANYLQAVEGSVDSAHTSFLHRGSGPPREEAIRKASTGDFSPVHACADTCYGFRYVAIRQPKENPDRTKLVKMTRYIFPTTAVTSAPMLPDTPALAQIFVPIDDEHTMHFSIYHSLTGEPVDEQAQREFYHLVPGVDLDAQWRPAANLENWYGQDRAKMAAGSWTGIESLLIQDAACQETMGPITDHAQEHLGTSDVAIIRLRRRMLESVRRVQAGEPPIGLGSRLDYGALTHIPYTAIDVDARWEDVQSFPGEYDVADVAQARA